MADLDKIMPQLLASYGAPMSVDNANRARNFFASNPDMAEKRALGLPRGGAQGEGDNSDLLDSMLNHVIAKTDAGPQTIQQPDSSGQIPPTPTTTPQLPRTSAPTQRIPTSIPTRAPIQTRPEESVQITPPRFDQIRPDPRRLETPDGSANSSTDFSTWLLAALGGGLATKALMNTGKLKGNTSTPTGTGDVARDVGDARSLEDLRPTEPKKLSGPNPDAKRLTYEPKLTDEVSDLSRLGIKDTTPPTKVSSSPQNEAAAKRAQIQAEIDADNRAQEALMAEQMKKFRAQKETDALLKAARAATGRR